MVRELEGRGWEVYGVDPMGPYERRKGSTGYSGLQTDYQHSYYHKTDAVDLFMSGVRTKFDLVVHCAYHVGGRAGIDGVNTNFAKNLQLDSALFEWAVRTKQKHVLYFSSSAAYPVHLQSQKNQCTLIEDDISFERGVYSTPDGNYGWAKLTGERLAADARRNGLKVSVVRPFSGYGEDQSLDYPFPSIVKRAKSGDLSVWGPRGQTRDWIHVSDVCNAALAIVDVGIDEPVNLCTGRGVEMGDLLAMAYEASHGEGSWTYPQQQIQYDESKPTGVFYRVGDPTRLHEYYTPKVSLEEGIRRALEA